MKYNTKRVLAFLATFVLLAAFTLPLSAGALEQQADSSLATALEPSVSEVESAVGLPVPTVTTEAQEDSAFASSVQENDTAVKDTVSLPEENVLASEAVHEPVQADEPSSQPGPMQAAGLLPDGPLFMPMAGPTGLPDPAKYEHIFTDPAVSTAVYNELGQDPETFPGYALSTYGGDADARWAAIEADLAGSGIISLTITGAAHLTGLEYLTSLQSLKFEGGSFENLSQLSSLSLLDLDIEGNSELLTLSGIEGSSMLTSLRVVDCPALVDISDLAGLTSITHVDLSGCSVSDISSLAGSVAAGNLQVLDLQGNRVSDVSVLNGSTSLLEVFLANNQLSGTVTLKNMASLITLDLRSNAITAIDDLSGCDDLKYLLLRDNQLASLAMLGNLATATQKNLRSADVSGERVFDISNNRLANCNGLEGWGNTSYTNILYLNNNQITDISGLDSSAVKELYLDDNPLVSLPAPPAFYASLTKLQTLSIERTGVTDIAPLVDVPDLYFLYAAGCADLELATKASFPFLMKLDLSGTNVAATLANLPSSAWLEELWLANNGITTAQFDDLLSIAGTLDALELLDIQNNDIYVDDVFFTKVRAAFGSQYPSLLLLYGGNQVGGDPLEFIDEGRTYEVLSLSGLDLGALNNTQWEALLEKLQKTDYIERLRLAGCNLNEARLAELVDALLADRPAVLMPPLLKDLVELDLSGNTDIGPFNYSALPDVDDWEANMGTILSTANGSLDKLCKAILLFRHTANSPSHYFDGGFTLKLAGCTGATPINLGAVEDIINSPGLFEFFELDMSGCGISDATPFALVSKPSPTSTSRSYLVFRLNLDNNEISDVSPFVSLVKDNMGPADRLCVPEISVKNQTVSLPKVIYPGNTLELTNPAKGLNDETVAPSGNYNPAGASYSNLTNEVRWSNIVPVTGTASFDFSKSYEFVIEYSTIDIRNTKVLAFDGTVAAEYERAPTLYTVTYDGDGDDDAGATLPPVASYAENDPVNITSVVPDKQGYEFAGWLNDYDNKVYWPSPKSPNSFTMPDANVVLKAQWKALYTVTYDGNNNTGGTVPAGGNYVQGATVNIATGVPTRTGYTFDGWLSDSDSKVYWAAPKSPNSFAMPGSNVTLTAQWKPDTPATTYKVTYNGNGNTGGTVPTEASYIQGATVNIAAGVPTRTGYTFDGWLSDSDSKVYWAAPKSPNSFAMPGNNATLTAQWKPDTPATTYKVTYAGNGNTGGTVPAGGSYVQGATVDIATGVPTRTGYTFDGWLSDSDSKVYWAAPKTPNSFAMPGNNVTLTAQWKQDTPAPTYTVTYDGNGNTGGTVPAGGSYVQGATVDIATGVPTRTGYTFDGWLSDEVNTVYWAVPKIPNQFTMPARNVTLTAQWAPVAPTTYTVTYHANNGTWQKAEDPGRYATGEAYTVFAADTFGYKGYSFVRWDTHAAGSGEQVLPGTSRLMGTANDNLYAVWKKDSDSSSQTPSTPSAPSKPSTSFISSASSSNSQNISSSSVSSSRVRPSSSAVQSATSVPPGVTQTSSAAAVSSQAVSSALAASSSQAVSSNTPSPSGTPDTPSSVPADVLPAPTPQPEYTEGSREATLQALTDAGVPMITIGRLVIPLHGLESHNVWSLLNLVLAVASLLTAVVILVTIIRRRNNTAGQDAGAKEYPSDKDTTENPEETKNNKNRGTWALPLKVAAVLLGVISPVLFFILENLRNLMSLLDGWTWLFVALLLIECVLAVLSRRKSQRDEEDEDEQAAKQA